jgi:hypothetical protein
MVPVNFVVGALERDVVVEQATKPLAFVLWIIVLHALTKQKYREGGVAPASSANTSRSACGMLHTVLGVRANETLRKVCPHVSNTVSNLLFKLDKGNAASLSAITL